MPTPYIVLWQWFDLSDQWIDVSYAYTCILCVLNWYEGHIEVYYSGRRHIRWPMLWVISGLVLGHHHWVITAIAITSYIYITHTHARPHLSGFSSRLKSPARTHARQFSFCINLCTRGWTWSIGCSIFIENRCPCSFHMCLCACVRKRNEFRTISHMSSLIIRYIPIFLLLLLYCIGDSIFHSYILYI